MSSRAYDALVLDLDGTLLDDAGRVRPRSRAALQAARAAGVRVLVATGRSSLSAHDVLDELDLDLPAIVFNGAGLYCPKKKRLLEERVLGTAASRASSRSRAKGPADRDHAQRGQARHRTARRRRAHGARVDERPEARRARRTRRCGVRDPRFALLA
ncbi:MAG: HAD-IIB family hydrolase [Planctomycetes bacterium]|nr:HAD-IIB family hydrolase [Planctomycetota bacterium]